MTHSDSAALFCNEEIQIKCLEKNQKFYEKTNLIPSSWLSTDTTADSTTTLNLTKNICKLYFLFYVWINSKLNREDAEYVIRDLYEAVSWRSQCISLLAG